MHQDRSDPQPAAGPYPAAALNRIAEIAGLRCPGTVSRHFYHPRCTRLYVGAFRDERRTPLLTHPRRGDRHEAACAEALG